jgi:hypothetical protein
MGIWLNRAAEAKAVPLFLKNLLRVVFMVIFIKSVSLNEKGSSKGNFSVETFQINFVMWIVPVLPVKPFVAIPRFLC